MADQTSDDEVFDFSNIEFTREDLVSALNDMVKEYRNLSHSFEEIKAKNISLKNSSIESSFEELENIDSLKTEMSKLMIENDLLRNESSELKAEVEKLTKEMSSWNQSARALHKLHEIQKSVYDKTSLGFSSSESSDGETSTQSQPAYDKFNKMRFVKANVIYDCYESIIFDDQNSPKLSDNGKACIGFQGPGNSKPSWLKNKLDKDKAKAGSKSFVPNQPRRNSRKAKSGWTKAQPRRDISGQKMKSKLNRSHNYAQTFVDPHTGKTVKEFFTLLPMTMASSLISSSHHIDFDSVFVFYVSALIEFFENSSVRDGMVVSTIKGKAVEISEEVFAATFELPTEGLTIFFRGVEITKITMGKEIKIPCVDERTWHLASLPQIKVDDKGKEPLKQKDPIKGRPHLEHYSLICADIDLLVKLRAQVIDEVDKFFNSFSLKKLATINIEDMTKKEEQVLYWGESESTRAAIQRKGYILLKYREILVRKFLESWKQNFVPGDGSSATDLKVIAMLSDLHLFVLDELKEQEIAHVGSINLCRSLQVSQPVFSVAPRQPIVLGLRISQFCTVFLDYSLFSSLPTADIRSFVGSIASNRTVLRNVQIFQASGSVAPRVQLLDEHPLSAYTSEDSAMNFDEIDTAATSTSLPAASIPKITEALAQLRASIEQIRERDVGAKIKDILLLHLDDFEGKFTARFDAQDRVLGVLRKDSNDQRSLLSLDLKSSHKQLGTQIATTALDVVDVRMRESLPHALMHRIEYLERCIATTALDVVDVRRVVREHYQELNAKITSLDEKLAATRNDLLEFRAQAQQTLNIITAQLSELVAYINRGGNDKKGEVSSSRQPPDDQNRGSGNTGGGGDTERSIVERLITDDRQRERSRGHSSGSYKRRRY
ncbi:mucin-2-like [Dorcoceras hygrometricum]|uniref:Mucin-2-like n=1 Tax=Dorcoceras hygrometricum TaxID=472368 RepID=A0A2Z7BA19_9LAMI|nr:mucin-2-like [Dorcoceras hygrometricum]